jgi:hypothetical protein
MVELQILRFLRAARPIPLNRLAVRRIPAASRECQAIGAPGHGISLDAHGSRRWTWGGSLGSAGRLDGGSGLGGNRAANERRLQWTGCGALLAPIICVYLR